MVAVANCAHLLVTALQRLRAGDSKPKAVAEEVRLNVYPVFLASLTTALGFLAMNFSEVPPYRHLGTFVAFGVLASFVLSITFLPALLSLLPLRARAVKRGIDPLMGGPGRIRSAPPQGSSVGIGSSSAGAGGGGPAQRIERCAGAFLR